MELVSECLPERRQSILILVAANDWLLVFSLVYILSTFLGGGSRKTDDVLKYMFTLGNAASCFSTFKVKQNLIFVCGQYFANCLKTMLADKVRTCVHVSLLTLPEV
jgi:hypothetical protein